MWFEFGINVNHSEFLLAFYVAWVKCEPQRFFARILCDLSIKVNQNDFFLFAFYEVWAEMWISVVLFALYEVCVLERKINSDFC